ncbi:MAG TPA: AmmeMemoRadiSam system protein B [Candidatus Sulfotelmatobacter sp.]|nr:AmmeMemoRadiSam system protein B [Candidatus Sulfotelmatobacter sp.]
MSPESPKEPPRPGRLIVPGDEPEEPTPSGGSRLVLPSEAEDEAQESRGQPSRIVLPPGVARETPEDLPEYPKVRPLVIVPVREGGRELLLVTDPLGVMRSQPVLGMEALPLLQLMDGTVSVQDLSTALMRESKDLRIANMVKDFVAQLDQLLMLDSPRFAEAYRELRHEYHELEIRPAALAGRAYPEDPAELRKFLDERFAAADQQRTEAGVPAPASNARPRAVLAPHLDPRRSGATIARAIEEVGLDGGPLRIVVLGTGHQLFEDPFALTRKHFETPLGKIPTDTAFVDAVASRLGESAYRSELAHRDEHSIEFVALFLKHRFGDRPLTLVPILCGGFHALIDEGKTPREDPEFEQLIAAVREAERASAGTTMYLAGVDFSHVGPRFGDPKVDERVHPELEKVDRVAIDAAGRGDADGWYAAIAGHADSTRICGLAPVYALLRCAEPGAGRLLHYEQSHEADTSLVSVAAMVWP